MSDSPTRSLDDSASLVVAKRDRPLLVLYYPGFHGHMMVDDADDAYAQVRQAGITKEAKLENLDVLLHTYGGDPSGAYRLGQAIRSFTHFADFLVPEYAYSAGSLLCLSGDCIWFGDNARLSPFDITLRERTIPASEVSLASVDNFLGFATEARSQMEKMLQSLGSLRNTTLDSDLLCELVRQVGALKIGEYFRERLLTANYAQVLLDSYMFRGMPNSIDRRRDVIDKMVHSSPSHQFIMDFHIARNASLTVEQLDSETSDLTKSVVRHLDDLTAQGLICLNLADEYKMPFIKFYDKNRVPQGAADDYDTTEEEEADQQSDGHFEGTFGDVQEEAGATEAHREPYVQGGSR